MEENLFGQPIAPPTRYAPGTREVQRPWTVQEDLVLWPVLLACGSQRAYTEAIRALCQALNRQSRPAGRPTLVQQVAGEVSIIEHRVITNVLGNERPEVIQMARFLLIGNRTGHAFTWAEHQRILRPWTSKPFRNEPRIDSRELRFLLDRDPLDAARMRDAATAPAPLEQPVVGRPARQENHVALLWAVREFVAAPADNEERLTKAWAELNRVAFQ